MTEEGSEKFTIELSKLNSNLELFNQKFDAALELAEKNMELRFLEHERDCPARKADNESVISVKKSVRLWSAMLPIVLRVVLPLLGIGGVTYTAINNNSQTKPAAQVAPAETGE